MMRHGLAVLGLGLIAAGPVLAQDAAGAFGVDCAADLASLGPAQGADAPMIDLPAGVQSGPDGCVAPGVAVEWTKGKWPQSVRAERLRWHSPQPGTVAVEITDLRLRLRQGAGMNDLAFGGLLANTGADIDAVASHDAATGNLSVAPLSIDLPGGSRIVAEAAFSGVKTITASGLPAEIGTIKAHRIRVDIVMASSFGRSILGPLVAEDAGFDAAMADAGTWVTTLPADMLPPDARRDIETLLGDLPNPRGLFTLTVQSDTGIGAGTLLPLLVRGVPRTAQDWTKAFGDLKIEAVYDPTATGN